MRRRFIIITLCFAWICANGAIWDAVQVVAWGRMFAANVRVTPVAEALRDTFDPAKPCGICRAVTNAKAGGEKHSPTQVESARGKITLVAETLPIWFVPAPVRVWPEATVAVLVSRSESVPVPPPRA